jgi:hypothetical protein
MSSAAARRAASSARAWDMATQPKLDALGKSAPFSPSNISAVAQWYRVSTAVDAGSGLAMTVQDILGGAAMTQSTDARKPTIGTGAKGLATLAFTDDAFAFPIAAVNNDATRAGIAFWFDFTTVDATSRRILTTDTGASASRFNFLFDNNAGRGLYVNGYNGASFRRALTGPVLPTTGKHFIYFGIDCSKSPESAQVEIGIDGVLQTLTFANLGGLNAWPSSLNTPTGNWSAFALTSAGGANPTVGSLYSSFFILNRQLTAAEHAALMAYEQPT